VHLLEWARSNNWSDEVLEAKWNSLRRLRATVTERIEPFRRDKVIRSSLEAEINLPEAEITLPNGALHSPQLLAELFISATVHKGEWAVAKTISQKCGRCWRHLPEVVEDGDLCARCEGVVNA